MRAAFTYALSRYRGQILGWGLSVGLLAVYMMPFYNTLVEQRQTLENLLASYPPELMAFFGDVGTMFTPEGYLTVELLSYLPLLLGIFAVLAGSGLLASDEENGTLDLILAHPISRTALYLGRLLAFLVATVLILGLIWLGLIIGRTWSEIELGPVELALPFVSALAVVLVFGALAVLLSFVLPARRLAAMVAGMLLVASFFITSLARINDDLQALNRFSPLRYYQAGDAVHGLNGAWLAGLLGVALVMLALAWWLFQRRDIRVAGEGSWRLPRLRWRPGRRQPAG